MEGTPRITFNRLKKKALGAAQKLQNFYRSAFKLSENFPKDTAYTSDPTTTNDLDFKAKQEGPSVRQLLTRFLTKYH